MSAELLRQAATILRERAEAATPGPWRYWNDGHVGNPNEHMGGISMPTPASDPERRFGDAVYIAMVHPDVGLALAKWLDDVAAGWAWDEDGEGCVWDDGMPARLDESVDSHAVKVARLIVGGAS